MTVRYIVLALETDSEEYFESVLTVVNMKARLSRERHGVPAAACDLESASATALGAQIAAIEYYVENVQRQLA